MFRESFGDFNPKYLNDTLLELKILKILKNDRATQISANLFVVHPRTW
jgi:hypothetical protein